LKISSEKNEEKTTEKLNLQEKLIYFLPGGHSLHTSSKNISSIQSLIDEYLYIILGGNLKPSSKISL
jgi:hypothetical protein